MAFADRLLRASPDPEGAHLLLARLRDAGVSLVALEPEEAGDAAEIVRVACTEVPYLAALIARDPRVCGRRRETPSCGARSRAPSPTPSWGSP